MDHLTLTVTTNNEYVAGSIEKLIDAAPGIVGFRADHVPTALTRLSANGIREPLALFAVLMEEKLRKKDHKTGWRTSPVTALTKLMKIEVMEYEVALEHFGYEEAQEELIDIANFAMILHDRLQVERDKGVTHEPGV